MPLNLPRSFVALTLAILMFVLGAAFSLFLFSPQKAAATSSDNISGWGWSENIGWVSFNCVDYGATCDVSPYGVTADETTGDLSGYAWSDNIGWISFNADDVSACPGTVCTPNLALSGPQAGEVSGWAKALSGDDDPSDDFEGWIALNCSSTSEGCSPNYGVNRQGPQLTGWAWGSEVIGWISFNCSTDGSCGSSDYKVRVNIAIIPECSDGLNNDPGPLSPATDPNTDYPDDLGCSDPDDPSESPNPPCSDGIDNDGAQGIDLADPGCQNDPYGDEAYVPPEVNPDAVILQIRRSKAGDNASPTGYAAGSVVISKGQVADVKWSVTPDDPAISCTMTKTTGQPGPSGSVGRSASYFDIAPTASVTLTLSCTGDTVTKRATARIIVAGFEEF